VIVYYLSKYNTSERDENRPPKFSLELDGENYTLQGGIFRDKCVPEEAIYHSVFRHGNDSFSYYKNSYQRCSPITIENVSELDFTMLFYATGPKPPKIKAKKI
jgi:hypothetical protein